MSAIWGVLHTDGRTVNKELVDLMPEALNLYKVDDIKSWGDGNILLGCGIQYITPESLHETLPYYDESKSLAITADAIIDNRKELFTLLDVPSEKQNNITDSELILLSYERWNQDCPKYLVGDFAFVIADKINDILFCARDHVGARTFYYYHRENTFAFCTVIKPLFTVSDSQVNLNERWIADFLALPGVIHQSEAEETIYKNILQLPPAYTMVISKSGLIKQQYWQPLLEIKPLKLKSDEEYDIAFRKVFYEAVNCRLRCNGEIAVSLSGGLDSGSVACVAADILAKEGKVLKAFSSLPMEGFEGKVPPGRIADEREYIDAIKSFSGNIDVTYCRSEGRNAFNRIDWLRSVYEHAYKNVENSYWGDTITEMASQNGCKVLLNGQYGNSTISFGDFFTHVKTLLKTANVIDVIKEINGCSKIYRISKYEISKRVIRAILPHSFRKVISNIINKNYDKFSNSPINRELIDKWEIEKRLEKDGFIYRTEKFYDLDEVRKLIANPIAFTQIGSIETKTALAYGIIKRDPTKDKRVIEFCLSLPSNQFVRNGEERHLVRRAMTGILPDKVRQNMHFRGYQGADWIQRLDDEYSFICEQLESVLNDKKIEKFINYDRIKHEYKLFKDKKESNIRMLLIVIILWRFINEDYMNFNF